MTLGPDTRFHYLNQGPYWTIESIANSRYVSDELGYTGGDSGVLRARATSVGPLGAVHRTLISSPYASGEPPSPPAPGRGIDGGWFVLSLDGILIKKD